jgi:hypothetical protein
LAEFDTDAEGAFSHPARTNAIAADNTMIFLINTP